MAVVRMTFSHLSFVKMPRFQNDLENGDVVAGEAEPGAVGDRLHAPVGRGAPLVSHLSTTLKNFLFFSIS